MRTRSVQPFRFLGICCCIFIHPAWALDSGKALTQFSRTIWTQKDGLPQDLVRSISQTNDGYLWLATDEGLVRFDGYEFTLFTKDNSNLPSNSVTALASGKDGSLWIGTANGMAHYDGQFRVYATGDGLPDNSISAIHVDHTGILWVVSGEPAGTSLSPFAQFMKIAERLSGWPDSAV
jgi:ligand-binding sensor domain-containing protein